MKLSLRMDLSDFINQPYEKDIISKLENIHKDDIKYYTTLWYRDGAVSSDDIQKFLVKYEKNLHLITRRDDVNHKQQIRFQYVYDKKEQIFEGLKQFHSTAKFCLSDKPTKKQKRNDYED